MGNHIARFAPAPLVSTEDYFSDFVNVARFEEELLGSRLFKVAKARRTRNGGSQRVVVKVLPCSNAKELLSVYRPTIQAYCRYVPFGHNLLSFNVKASPNGRNILIIRDYVDQSLVDRLCTRPFLCVEEKKWIAFQLLQSLSQLHSPFDLNRDSRVADRGPGFERDEPATIFCHGDIKAENVLLTSWGWTLLADPAPFKPCWLPVDNPSEFTHYFDSSRRRVCYLAPERFVECKEPQPFEITHEKSPLEADHHSAVLTRDIEIIETVSGSPKQSSRMRDSPVGSDFTPVDQDLGVAADYISDISKQSVPTEHPGGKVFPGSKSNFKGVTSVSSSLQSVGVESSNPEPLVTQAMDLFSTGCVLLELFTDGSVAFTLADLLAYRAGDSSRLEKLLEQISCEDIKNLISRLLSPNPNLRGSAEHHLAEHRGKAFPEVFYSHLFPYMRTFINPTLRNPTLRITFLRNTLSKLLQEITCHDPEGLAVCAVVLCTVITSALRPTASFFATQTPKIMASSSTRSTPVQNIPVYGATNSTRSTCDPIFIIPPNDNRLLESGKIDALLCLLELANYLPVHMLYDRIVPYCVDLTSAAHSCEVRCLALESLTQVLRQATRPPLQGRTSTTEVSFLTEYLFPTLAPLSVDPKNEIRLTYARCLPSLTESALNFLDSSSLHTKRSASAEKCSVTAASCESKPQLYVTELNPMESALDTYDTHLSLLRTHIQDRFSDLDRQVRYALMSTNGLAKLAAFFGRSHTTGTLLSHMITFLNDKEDHGLRISFYRQIVPLVSLIGAQSVSVIRPLFEQGLMDPNETVIEVCLHSLTRLVRRRLFSAPVAVGFLSRCLGLTSHPTRRIRQYAVGYITAFAKQAEESVTLCVSTNGKFDPVRSTLSSKAITSASIFARLMSADPTRTIFRRPVHQCYDNDAVLLSVLQPPISRPILQYIVAALSSPECVSQSSSSDSPIQLLQQFFQLLKERDKCRAVSRSSENPCYASPGNEMLSLVLMKARSLGMTELMESQLLYLSHLIKNMCEAESNRSQSGQSDCDVRNDSQCVPVHRTRTIDITNLGASSAFRQRDFSQIFVSTISPADLLLYLRQLTISLKPAVLKYELLLREDLFSGRLPVVPAQSIQNANDQIVGRGLFWHPVWSSTKRNTDLSDSPDDKSSKTTTSSSWKLASSVPESNAVPNSGRIVPPGQHDRPFWSGCHPNGVLVAHLQEHRPGVVKLAPHESGRLIASCSSGDGTVKLWNCGLWTVNADGYLNSSAPGSTRVNTDSALRAQTSKPAGLAQSHTLPTRSWWTYTAKSTGATQESCRDLVWVGNGSSLVTVSRGRWLHRIDVVTGRGSALEDLVSEDHDRVGCLAAPSVAQFPAYLNLSHSCVFGGGDMNLVAHATASNLIFGRDMRIPFSSPPAWFLKQDRLSGLIRSLNVHSCHTWLVVGTSRGQLVFWDLRYQRPIACVQHRFQTQAAILNLQLTEVYSGSPTEVNQLKSTGHFADNDASRKRTLVVATTDQQNGVTVWDLEACASSFSAAVGGKSPLAQNITPVADGGLVATAWTKSSSYSPVRSILCLPTYEKQHLPSVIAGGKDGRLRLWDFATPAGSKILIYARRDNVLLKPIYKESVVHGIRGICEIPGERDKLEAGDRVSGLLTVKRDGDMPSEAIRSSVSTLLQESKNANKTGTFPSEGSLDVLDPSVGHGNIISDISLLYTSHFLLVSASMDGVIKIWR